MNLGDYFIEPMSTHRNAERVSLVIKALQQAERLELQPEVPQIPLGDDWLGQEVQLILFDL